MKFKEAPEVLETAKTLRELVYRAEYKKALKISEKLYRKYPKNAYAIFLYAVQIGDSVVSGFDPKAKPVKKIATRMLVPLLKRMREIPVERRMALRNEVYWFSGEGNKQYRLGFNEVKRGEKIGYYSMGVGGWCVARKYALARKTVLAKRWAEKSIRAWEQYFKFNDKYYNAWSWYARSLGFIGKETEMMRALKMAMRLSGKPISFPEFQEVLIDNQKLRQK